MKIVFNKREINKINKDLNGKLTSIFNGDDINYEFQFDFTINNENNETYNYKSLTKKDVLEDIISELSDKIDELNQDLDYFKSLLDKKDNENEKIN
jgi:hypothetical protein